MLTLLILPDEFTLYQFDRLHQIPTEWLNNLPWYTVSKTTSELSVLCPSASEPLPGAKKKKDGWRCLQVDAQMDFSLVGILASIVDPLRDNKIPVFVISTYDTDYILIEQDQLEHAIGVLNRQKNMSLKPGQSIFPDTI
ncbi:hypothetical protein VTP01DRAFT_8565 [Rhizomucor pusillus]|uniref:uncharacterized protein n=1 Tax=Rhizomucor pusillus TaxID=4840 RepID=UPI00374212E9